jgi:hypothetical protein
VQAPKAGRPNAESTPTAAANARVLSIFLTCWCGLGRALLRKQSMRPSTNLLTTPNNKQASQRPAGCASLAQNQWLDYHTQRQVGAVLSRIATHRRSTSSCHKVFHEHSEFARPPQSASLMQACQGNVCAARRLRAASCRTSTAPLPSFCEPLLTVSRIALASRTPTTSLSFTFSGRRQRCVSHYVADTGRYAVAKCSHRFQASSNCLRAGAKQNTHVSQAQQSRPLRVPNGLCMHAPAVVVGGGGACTPPSAAPCAVTTPQCPNAPTLKRGQAAESGAAPTASIGSTVSPSVLAHQGADGFNKFLQHLCIDGAIGPPCLEYELSSVEPFLGRRLSLQGLGPGAGRPLPTCRASTKHPRD